MHAAANKQQDAAPRMNVEENESKRAESRALSERILHTLYVDKKRGIVEMR